MSRTIHAMKPLMVVRLRNQVKTALDPAETLRYTRHARAALKRTAIHGTPCLLQVRKIFGACPVIASE